MSVPTHRAFAIAALLLAPACRPVDEAAATAAVMTSATAVARATRLTNALANTERDSTGDSRVGTSRGGPAPLARWLLPAPLGEISGLALTSDNRLLVHGDEYGRVWELDYRRGVLVKQFSLGDGWLQADFEGMTRARDTLWMLTSDGRLFAFREGKADERVGYTTHDTGLGKACEFEGVAFDSTFNALLLSCKRVLGEKRDKEIVIYRWNLSPPVGVSDMPLTVPVEHVRGTQQWKSFQPSDLAVDPVTGNYVVVSSGERALISMSRAGDAVSAREMPPQHQQIEGVAITRDGLLIVSDEAVKGPATITLYRWP